MVWITHDGAVYRMKVSDYRFILKRASEGMDIAVAIDRHVPQSAFKGLLETGDLTIMRPERAKALLEQLNRK